MKSYQGAKSVHLVGQAWQIRALLKQWQRQWGPEVRISELLRQNDTSKCER